jgi:hypothetical protein
MTASKVPEPLRRDKRTREDSTCAAPAADVLRRDARNPDTQSSKSVKPNELKPVPERR